MSDKALRERVEELAMLWEKGKTESDDDSISKLDAADNLRTILASTALSCESAPAQIVVGPESFGYEVRDTPYRVVPSPPGTGHIYDPEKARELEGLHRFDLPTSKEVKEEATALAEDRRELGDAPPEFVQGPEEDVRDVPMDKVLSDLRETGLDPAPLAKMMREGLRASQVADRRKLVEGLMAVKVLIENSHGVVGLHLNGDVAPWEELRTGGRFESWLVAFDAALAEEAPHD
jgi:hypothetical protein